MQNSNTPSNAGLSSPTRTGVVERSWSESRKGRLTSRAVVRQLFRRFGGHSLEEMNVLVCMKRCHVFGGSSLRTLNRYEHPAGLQVHLHIPELAFCPTCHTRTLDHGPYAFCGASSGDPSHTKTVRRHLKYQAYQKMRLQIMKNAAHCRNIMPHASWT